VHWVRSSGHFKAFAPPRTRDPVIQRVQDLSLRLPRRPHERGTKLERVGRTQSMYAQQALSEWFHHVHGNHHTARGREFRRACFREARYILQKRAISDQAPQR
jgi:hypothetical protein